MKKLFIDTGAFLAKEVAADQHHTSAVAGWAKAEAAILFSSEHILDESATLLSRRTNYAFAAGWGHDVLKSEIRWLKSEPSDWSSALTLMRKYADQGVSFTDCLSFVLMKRAGLKDVFGFDHHFESAGFRLWPMR